MSPREACSCAPKDELRRMLAGILICLNCAGAHRSMGVHISKVRSTTLDQFTDDEFTWIEHQGNLKSNTLYESAIPQRMRRPCMDSPDCIRRRWLREKYEHQMFTAGQEHKVPHPHETLSGWLSKRGSFMKTWKRCEHPAHTTALGYGVLRVSQENQS